MLGRCHRTPSMKTSYVPNICGAELFGSISCLFSMDWRNAKHVQKLFMFLGGRMGPIHPVWGHAGVVKFSCFAGSLGVSRALEMILRHLVSSCLNVSQHAAIWKRFK